MDGTNKNSVRVFEFAFYHLVRNSGSHLMVSISSIRRFALYTNPLIYCKAVKLHELMQIRPLHEHLYMDHKTHQVKFPHQTHLGGPFVGHWSKFNNKRSL